MIADKVYGSDGCRKALTTKGITPCLEKGDARLHSWTLPETPGFLV